MCCLTVLVSCPECMNSELLEELMSSEGESLSLPLMVWPFPARKTVLCDFTQLESLATANSPSSFLGSGHRLRFSLSCQSLREV